MALEISEIGVRIAVGGDPAPSAAGTGGESGGPDTPPTQSRLQAIVKACTQRVRAALRRLQAR